MLPDKPSAPGQAGGALLSKAACSHLRVCFVCQVLCKRHSLFAKPFLRRPAQHQTADGLPSIQQIRSFWGSKRVIGSITQQAAAFILEMFLIFCLRHLGSFSLILLPLLLLLQCLRLEISIRTRYNQPTNFPEFQSIGIQIIRMPEARTENSCTCQALQRPLHPPHSRRTLHLTHLSSLAAEVFSTDKARSVV